VKYYLLSVLFISQIYCFGQSKERTEVKQVIDNFISAYNNQDIETLNNILDRSVGFLTVFYDGSKSILTAESIEMFFQNMENTENTTFREELLNYKINASKVLASVWCDYNFYYNGKYNHCGENAFQLYKSAKGWKIIQITDTRYSKDQCKLKAPVNKYDRKATLIKFIDQWHKNAAESDLESYFESISEDGIYIGTDPEEYWTKKEFYEWSKPYFEKDKGWKFETIERNIFFADDEDLAWFSEKLNTSMGVCHATGVAEHSLNGWKIKYYQLSVTIPNELLKDFIKLKKTSNSK
jgi:ketosteroid isomerase-like protein